VSNGPAFFATAPPATRAIITANSKGGPPPGGPGGIPGGMI
jgi:hypothetical protein